MQGSYRHIGATLVIAFVGGAVLAAFDLPAAWMVGAMLGTAVASMAGMQMEIPSSLRKAASLTLGASIGCSVTPNLFSQIEAWPLSIVGVVITAVFVQGATQLYLRRVAGWDFASSFLAAIPGVTSYVVVIALTTAADVRKVAVAHSVRAFLLVLLLPPLLQIPALRTFANGAVSTPFGTISIMGAALAGALLFERLKIPGAWLLGSVLGSALLHMFGGVTERLPPEIMLIGLALLGAVIGSRFSGVQRSTLGALGLHAVMAFVVGLVVSLAGAWAVSELLELPFDRLAMSYAPGGIDTLTALAFATGIDSVFVATHQLARFILVAMVVPVAAGLMARHSAKAAKPDDPDKG